MKRIIISNKASSRLFQQIDISPLRSMEHIYRIHSMLLKAEYDFLKIIKSLKYFQSESSIPLNTIKVLANQVDSIIGVLGQITLITNSKIDEISVIMEINDNLGLKESYQIEYLNDRIRELISSIISSSKDNSFQNCLDEQKARAWRLMEAMNEYTEVQYKQSIL